MRVWHSISFTASCTARPIGNDDLSDQRKHRPPAAYVVRSHIISCSYPWEIKPQNIDNVYCWQIACLRHQEMQTSICRRMWGFIYIVYQFTINCNKVHRFLDYALTINSLISLVTTQAASATNGLPCYR